MPLEKLQAVLQGNVLIYIPFYQFVYRDVKQESKQNKQNFTSLWVNCNVFVRQWSFWIVLSCVID